MELIHAVTWKTQVQFCERAPHPSFLLSKCTKNQLRFQRFTRKDAFPPIFLFCFPFTQLAWHDKNPSSLHRAASYLSGFTSLLCPIIVSCVAARRLHHRLPFRCRSESALCSFLMRIQSRNSTRSLTFSRPFKIYIIIRKFKKHCPHIRITYRAIIKSSTSHHPQTPTLPRLLSISCLE